MKLLIKYIFRYLYNYCKNTKEILIRLDLGFYWFWVAIRILLTVIPQTGYIHPDEYFQTVEVFAGDVFGTEVSVPWEFNTTFPIRSVPVIYLTMGLPLSLLKRVSELTEFYLGFRILDHYTLLVIPRISMCLISFISDICLFKICYNFGQNYKERLIMYSSSFVCLIFMTRTFTNTIEITCFNILLCLVASCMAESEKVNYQNKFLKNKYDDATTVIDQVRVTKLIKLLPKHSVKQCIPISVVAVSGFFNRPTFILFACTPLFFWFQRGLTIKSTFLLDFHQRLFLFLFCCIPVVCFFIYFDSAYYGYITWGEVLNFEIGTNNFIVTPLNFVKYNIDPLNLSKHGLHPRFLHFIINVPLLFNVLGVTGLIVIAKLIFRSVFSNWTLLPRSQSITGMMTLSFLIPVLGLSVFPHQEPRFIIPILIPLVFLYSHLVRNFEEHFESVVPFRKRFRKQKEIPGIFKYPMKYICYFEKAMENIDNRYNVYGRYLANVKCREILRANNAAKPMTREENNPTEATTTENDEGKEKTKSKKNSYLTKWWFILNGLCVLFFGFLHQGGIYGLSRDFHHKLLVKPKYTTYHLITSHIYSLPLHLLSIKRNYKSKGINFVSYEMGSSDFESIYRTLVTVARVAESKKKSLRRNYRVFYALPTSLVEDFKSGYGNYMSNYSYQIQNVFFPHFSTEALPNFKPKSINDHIFGPLKIHSLQSLFDCLGFTYLLDFFYQFSLTLIEISLVIT